MSIWRIATVFFFLLSASCQLSPCSFSYECFSLLTLQRGKKTRKFSERLHNSPPEQSPPASTFQYVCSRFVRTKGEGREQGGRRGRGGMGSIKMCWDSSTTPTWVMGHTVSSHPTSYTDSLGWGREEDTAQAEWKRHISVRHEERKLSAVIVVACLSPAEIVKQ